LRITKEYVSDKNKITKTRIPEENMLTVLTLAPIVLKQAVMLKSIVLDPE